MVSRSSCAKIMTIISIALPMGTHAAASGIDPRTLAGILGHAKPSFTLDAYTHVTTDMQKRAAGIVGNFITDTFGKELKPWQRKEKAAKAR